MSIERNFNKYLFNLVKSNAIDNKVAKTLALNYQRLNRNAKDKFFESLMLAYANFSDSAFDNIKFEDASTSDSDSTKKDYRLKAVRLSNVRGIPKEINSTKYGFDLFENGEIQNAIFLGSNGTGKSSLFNAIEFIYSHEVAEKKLRVKNPDSLNEDDFIEYLEHFNEAPECEIETPSGKFSLRNRVFKTDEELKTIYPDTHFISDYDIYNKGHLNYLGKNDDTESFHFLIASSLGLQDYLDFTNLLKSVSTYRRSKESNDRKKFIDNQNQLLEEIRKNQEQIAIKTEEIKKLKEKNIENVHEDSREKLAVTITSIKPTSFSFPFDKLQFQKFFDTYRNAQEKFIGLSVNLNLQTEAQFLTLGLELINHTENCPLCENSKSTLPEIKRKIEKRISEIKEFEVASKNLEQSIRNIYSVVKDVLTNLQSVGRTLKNEFDKITAIPELAQIHKDEKELIELIANETRILLEIEEKISNIISSNDVLSKKDEAISKLIKHNESILLIDVANTPNALDKFADKRQKKIVEIEATLSASKNPITHKQQIIIFESQIKEHLNTININGQQIKNLEREIEKLTTTINTISEIKLKAGEFAKVLDIEVNKLVANLFDPIKETIEEILNDYLIEEGVTLEINLEKQISNNDPDSPITTIIAKISRENQETGKLETHSPSKYFNTFRFRLFCTMVSLSVVIAARKYSGINLPLVLDDVFYASDYNSKTTFRKFISTVIMIFRKFNSEMPLQLILFTHDELVFDSALDAIQEFEQEYNEQNEGENVEWKSPIQQRTLFARLFSANDVDPLPVESPFGKYWDLSYKIPAKLEPLLKQE